MGLVWHGMRASVFGLDVSMGVALSPGTEFDLEGAESNSEESTYDVAGSTFDVDRSTSDSVGSTFDSPGSTSNVGGATKHSAPSKSNSDGAECLKGDIGFRSAASGQPGGAAVGQCRPAGVRFLASTVGRTAWTKAGTGRRPRAGVPS